MCDGQGANSKIKITVVYKFTPLILVRKESIINSIPSFDRFLLEQCDRAGGSAMKFWDLLVKNTYLKNLYNLLPFSDIFRACS